MCNIFFATSFPPVYIYILYVRALSYYITAMAGLLLLSFSFEPHPYSGCSDDPSLGLVLQSSLMFSTIYRVKAKHIDPQSTYDPFIRWQNEPNG